MNPTADTIIGQIRGLLREEAGSDLPVMADEFLFTILTDVDYEIRRSYRRGGGNVPVAIHKDTGFSVIGETNLTEAITSATTDFDVGSSASFESSGALAVWDQDMPDLIYYTGNAANNFSGVTDIGFSHAVGDAVQALYKLPSDFKDFYRTDEYPNGVQINGNPVFYTDSPPVPGKFTVRDDGTNKYLWVHRGESGDISVMYEKTTDTIDSTSDRVGFSEEWLYFYVWRGIEKALFGRGDYAIIDRAKNEAAIIKRDILTSRNIGRRVRVRPLHHIRTNEDYLSYNDTH